MKKSKSEFPFLWELQKTNFTKDKGKVFSCFACGGGSTMGYKLAGFDVLGCNEIDPKMIEMYVNNHNPKFAFNEPIQTFKLREDLPEELFDLDILDGSPPCSSFSMAGNRSEDWGKEKRFAEGQSLQVLDTLFFDFIDLAKKLKPKVVVAENVKGLLLGDAREYVRKIYREFDSAGYFVQHFLLNSSNMGVPQRRERVFFIALRKELATPFLKQIDLFSVLPELKLNFNQEQIPFDCIREEQGNDSAFKMSEKESILWEKCKPGNSFSTVHERGSWFSNIKVSGNNSLPTIVTNGFLYDYKEKRKLFDREFIKGGSFPIDYNFGKNKIPYVVGMSVPPLMVANISKQIYEQWLKKMI
jgi:DNA (cytosine-5)-methyltransferase 1